MLLGEIVASGDTLKLLTHVATVVAVDACTFRIQRHVGRYGACAPNGIIAAVDLSYFTTLMTRKATYQWNRAFYADEWDSSVALVPVKMEYRVTSSAPYLLSFLSTGYWTQRVGYNVECFEVGTAGEDMNRSTACTMQVRKSRARGVLTVREAIVDRWIGGPRTRGAPPGRQRDAYEALAMMNTLMGTHGVYDTALNLATELSRGFHLGAVVDGEGSSSQGLMCFGEDMISGRRFGINGPRVKQYGFDDPDTVSGQVEWARRYNTSPSGMLAEGMAVAEGYLGGVWPHARTFACNSFSVVVSTADHELRIARALQLIEPGTPSVVPRHGRSLSFWLSGNALLLAGVTWGAYLSSGANWAMINGMLTPSSEMTTSIKALVPLVTNRVINCVDTKRRLYRNGNQWMTYAATTQASSTDDERCIIQIQIDYRDVLEHFGKFYYHNTKSWLSKTIERRQLEIHEAQQ
ncbi:hypothetical protein HPB51_027614 [Rhipicephalus microplus]|uniref:Uncharacterized protein n=1 Tax=Rhipicephalus microplus TaxID=6941 RepID=A0A9J6CZN6_RHIMP|nr:hypothetical protein HPB51_027614 [Rhipicephalus microplus]